MIREQRLDEMVVAEEDRVRERGSMWGCNEREAELE